MNFRTIIAATCTTLSVFAGLTGLPKDGQAEPLVAEADINTSKPAADIPDTELTRDATRLVREAEGDFLFEHSVRVYQWAALAGRRKGLIFDPELLYVAALFHDFGLTDRYGQSHLRFEVDGANAARDFLRGHAVAEVSRENIWLAIALHTTNGISANLSPTAALVAEGANMDLVGAGYDDFTTAERNAVEAAHPHPPHFADGFMDILYKSLGHRPETTQGTGLADVMAYKDPAFRRRDFSNLMRNSKWAVGD
ncbi:HD domain-containing protein [Rhizobium johnstonii]|jgi:HD superfamily phosphodiesterase|uniref:HD domain-containing protein n=1 Tax=Rhizobium leguminosarum TaxID=384 RepID=A0A4Q8X604_RHILE|nr:MULTISPECIES: HD domain-containing protein [Rhizobium]MDV4165856.1 HD domain-containing protein [Rhizobium leguminosarum]MDV4176364.1 HD domain-containing protein [Rhizobium leguminosarum]QIO56038.1 HD domain-containing protein [Rhizobium leguminosarum bv. trifolii]QJX09943.1 HD domain-containing protein [Rhizobium brockwellii]TAU72066.1 HD domain-containing protein [Rhizobium leguminosarum]